MKFLLILLSFLLSVSCSEFGDDRVDNTPTNPDNEQPGGNENGGNNGDDNTQKPSVEWGDERSYVFDLTSVPEVRMTVSLDEWNRLLAEYDRNHDTKEYFHCDVKMKLKEISASSNFTSRRARSTP